LNWFKINKRFQATSDVGAAIDCASDNTCYHIVITKL